MVIAVFTQDRIYATATGLWQWDYGQVLRIQGLALPSAVEIHFSLQEKGGDAITRIGTAKDGVTDVVIPDSMLEVETAQDYVIYAFVYLSDKASGQTEYKIKMLVTARPKPEGFIGQGNTTFWAVVDAVQKIADGKVDISQGMENAGKYMGVNSDGLVTPVDAPGGGTVTDDQIKNAVGDYLQENPPRSTADAVGYGDGDVGSALDDLFNKMDDLMYEEIQIVSFTNNVETSEMGSTVNTVTLRWDCNKIPTALTLDGSAIDVSSNTKTIEGAGITANKAYTLAATDERGVTVVKTTSLSFLKGVYWGTAGTEPVDNAFILSLSKGLQSTRAKTFTVNAGEGQHIYYAVPTRYGTPAFKVGGFDGGFTKTAAIDFTNASGYTEPYDVWISDNANLGSTTVVIT